MWSDELKCAMMKGCFAVIIVCPVAEINNSMQNLVRTTKTSHSEMWLDK